MSKQKKALDKSESKVCEQQEQLQHMNNHVEQMEQAVEITLIGLHQDMAKYKVIHDSYLKRIDEYEQEIQQQDAYLNSILDQNNHKIQKLEQQIHSLHHQIQNKDQIHEKDYHQMNQKQEEIQKLNMIIQQYEEQIQNHNEKYTQLKNQFDLIMEKSHDTNNLKDHELIQEIEINQTDNTPLLHTKQFQEEVTRLKKIHEKQLAKLHEEISELKSTNISSKTRLNHEQIDQILLDSPSHIDNVSTQNKNIPPQQINLENPMKQVNITNQIDGYSSFFIKKFNQKNTKYLKQYYISIIEKNQQFQPYLNRNKYISNIINISE